MKKWSNTEKYLEKKVGNFEVRNKEDSKTHKLLGKILFWTKWNSVWTTFYPKVWKSKSKLKDYRTLQHEAVHLLDAQTFFGLLPVKLKWFNVFLFTLIYSVPQILALLALLAFVNLWWLLCLLFLLPIPAPGRMIAEIRAYRRTRELGRSSNRISYEFSNSSYLYMWPFRRHVRKMLLKDSPYKKEMDALLEE